MSSRVLKKLQGENELDILDQDASDIDNDNSFIANSGARKKQFDGNRYDLVIFHAFLHGSVVPTSQISCFSIVCSVFFFRSL